MNRCLLALFGVVLVLVAACGGGDDSDGSATPTGPASTSPAGPTLTPLEQKLASVILQPSDLPEGLEGSAPDFATNDDIAGQDQQQLATLVAVGRQLGVDVQFIPTDRLDPNFPVRGGIETSASVYTTSGGAMQTFRDTADQARANDWAANYPGIPDLKVTEVQQTIGDESLWLRITGTAECSLVETPTAGPGGVVPSATCLETKLIILDDVIFRVGRVRGFLQISGLFPTDSPSNVFVDHVTAWAQLVVQRAQTAFPG